MNTDVLRYLQDDEKMTTAVASAILSKLERHPDILAEFQQWIRSKAFAQRSPVSVEGYSAERLVNSTYLRPVGAFNYLIYLREQPNEALDALKRGLPRK